MILAIKGSLGHSILQALNKGPFLVSAIFSFYEIRQGVSSNLLTLTFFLPFIQEQQIMVLLLTIFIYLSLCLLINDLHVLLHSIQKSQHITIIMSRINQSAIPQNAQIRKMYCAYHPNEILTNFCCDSNCLMPLCPNCIVQHTEQHFLQNNKPIYVNIQDIIAETKQKCYQNIIIFEELSRSNDIVFDYLMCLKESIHNQLHEDKQVIIQQVNSLFQEYEDKLYQQAIARYKEQDVYSRKENANITDFINQQIQTLHDSISLLKSQNCLAGLISFYSNGGKIYEESIRELNQYVSKHKKAGKISINVDAQKLMKTLDCFCENNMVVQYLNEDMLKQKIVQEAKIRESRTNKQIKSMMSKLGKKNAEESHYKENNLNQSNSEYRNAQRKSDDYYKIDSAQSRKSQIHQDKFPFPSSYLRSHQSMRPPI